MGEQNIPRPGQQANYLTLLIGKDKTQVRVRMKHKGIVIGRNTKRSSVDFDTKPYDGTNKGVSREHVLIVPKDDYFYVQDLDSINSTWHNKVRMKPMIAENLYHGDVLHLGELRVEVHYAYDDEIHQDLGATTNFGNASQEQRRKRPQVKAIFEDDVPEIDKATRVFGEEKMRGDPGDKTGDLKDNPD